jgi:thioredoxin reductase (NADPH)
LIIFARSHASSPNAFQNTMKTPIILAVDDDSAVLRALERDLRKQYRKDYRILTTLSANEALETLRELKTKQEVVALLLSDQRMPEMQGVDYLTIAKDIYPKAKRALLTAYSDIEAAIRAINDVGLDYYLAKPWDPPEEKLYPALNELLEEWQASYKPDFTGLRVLGYQWSPKSHIIKDFLTGNLVPYKWLDVQTHPDALEALALHSLETIDLPAILFEDGTVAKNPQPVDIATRIGLQSKASANVYDVVIVGAGPSGLASAVYGSSEGLKTLLVEKRAPGGQAGTSSRIENYLGFPTGLSGAELTRRAISQAVRLGAEFLAPQSVEEIVISPNPHEHYKTVKFIDGTELVAKSKMFISLAVATQQGRLQCTFLILRVKFLSSFAVRRFRQRCRNISLTRFLTHRILSFYPILRLSRRVVKTNWRNWISSIIKQRNGASFRRKRSMCLLAQNQVLNGFHQILFAMDVDLSKPGAKCFCTAMPANTGN